MRPPVVKHQLVAHRLQPFQQTDAGLGGQQCISNPEDLLCIDQYHRDLKVTTIRHFCIQQMSLICALLPSLEKMVPRGLIKKLWCPIFHMTCRSSKSLYSSKDFVRHPVFFSVSLSKSQGGIKSQPNVNFVLWHSLIYFHILHQSIPFYLLGIGAFSLSALAQNTDMAIRDLVVS